MRRPVELSTILVALLAAMPALAEVPELLNFQGRLTDAQGKSVSGSRSMTFRIYDAGEGGTLLWEESQSVAVSEGVYNVLLGSIQPIDTTTMAFDEQYYLGIEVEGDGEMLPRYRFGAAPYALGSRATRLECAATQNAPVSVAGATWVDIPGATVNVSLPRPLTVEMRAAGSAIATGGTMSYTHAGFRFVVDSTPYGHSGWGDRIVVVGKIGESPGPGGWMPWRIERQIQLGAGPHAIKVQVTGWDSSTTSVQLDTSEYSATRLRVTAY